MPRPATRTLRAKKHRLSDGNLSTSIMLQTPMLIQKKLENLSESHGIPIATFYRLCAAIGFVDVSFHQICNVERNNSDIISSIRLSVHDFFRLQKICKRWSATSKDVLTAAIIAGYERIGPSIEAEIADETEVADEDEITDDAENTV